MKRKKKLWACASIVKNNMNLRFFDSKMPLIMHAGLAAGLFFLAVSHTAVAEDIDLLDFYQDDETVSISTGTNKPIRLAPSVATVLTEEDISRLGATSLDQVLESVPGLHVSVAKNNKLNSVYSIRGIHTARNAQVLVLIDDIPVRQLYGGGRPSNFFLPVENIKRVEVVRGPGSALFGADAFAGVINVITKGAAEIEGIRAGVTTASFGTRDFWMQYGAEVGEWQFVASIENSRSDGDNGRVIQSDFQTIFDNVFETNASLAPGALATSYEVTNFRLGVRSENWDIGFLGWQQDDAGLGNGVAQALDTQGKVDVDYYVLSAEYSMDYSDDVDLEVKMWASSYDEQDDTILLPPGTRVPIGADGNLSFTGTPVLFTDGLIGNPGGEEERYSGEVSAKYTGHTAHHWRLAAGFELQRGKVRETKNFGPGVLDGTQTVVDGTLTDVTNTAQAYADIENREIYFASIQDSWNFRKDWEATIGLRYDWYSDVGSTLNPRAAVVWSTSYNLTSKLLYGRAFRAPSFAELFAINNPVILGNRNLDPETIDTVELAFDYRFSEDISSKLNFYWYRIEDAIEFVPATDPSLPAGSSIADNAHTQKGKGFEWELNFQFNENLSVASNYSMQFAELGSTGERVADAPGRQLYVDANYEFLESWNIHLAANWVADRRRSPNDMRPQLKDFTHVDISLRKLNLIEGLNAQLTARNLFDKDSREGSASGLLTAIPDDLPLAGRSLSLRLSYSLR